MEKQNKASFETSRVIIISLKKAQLYIGEPYLTKRHLAWLFEIDNSDSVVLLDPNAEEVNFDENGVFNCHTSKHYTIVTEEDIDEEEDPHFTDNEIIAHIQRVEERRKKFIEEHWKPIHKWLYEKTPNILPDDVEKHLVEISKEVYKLDKCFSDNFRRDFLDEVLEMEKSGLPLFQPNTMNRYGIVFADFGLIHIFEHLYKQIDHLVRKYFPKVDFPIISNHSFLVQYKPNQQKDLGLHIDDASFTINLCLENTNTDEGELFFKEEGSSPELRIKNIPGTAILHYGKHMHGAYPINQGVRYNLIIWYLGINSIKNNDQS